MADPRMWIPSVYQRAPDGITGDARYTDRTLIDLRGALEQLPPLPLPAVRPGRVPLAATGTDGSTDPGARFTVCRPVYSPRDESGTRDDIPDKLARNHALAETLPSDTPRKRCASASSVDQMRALGLEPRTHGLKGRCSTD